MLFAWDSSVVQISYQAVQCSKITTFTKKVPLKWELSLTCNRIVPSSTAYWTFPPIYGASVSLSLHLAVAGRCISRNTQISRYYSPAALVTIPRGEGKKTTRVSRIVGFATSVVVIQLWACDSYYCKFLWYRRFW